MQEKTISGFSKWSKSEKIDWVCQTFFASPGQAKQSFANTWLSDPDQQKTLDGFSENTIANFHLPYGIAPNFLIDGKVYAVPMAIEESSVVAAASSAAKYWLTRGGFKTTILGTTKVGHLHFTWPGKATSLIEVFPTIQQKLLASARSITANMEKRGGGISALKLKDFSSLEPNYYQLLVEFETCDSMGANFINSVLEAFAQELPTFFEEQKEWPAEWREVDVLMAILSNYTPQCVVRAEVSCSIDQLGCPALPEGTTFAKRFALAVRAAQIDPFRAATHNKGIMNGIDAVVVATGNDFRAVEAGAHAYASRNGQYQSLSQVELTNNDFTFWLDIPLAIGTVGGLTKLHPLANQSLALLDLPSATQLMRIIAATGLAQNFAALKSLITTGIQKGHMKMHLLNILTHFGASNEEVLAAKAHFQDKLVSFSNVRNYLQQLRGLSIK